MENENLLNIYPVNSGPQREEYSAPAEAGYFDDVTSTSSSVFQIKFYKALSICRNITEFLEKIEKTLKSLKFEEYAFTRLIHTDIENPITTMPPALAESYMNEGLYENDLTLQFALSDNGPIYYSQIEDSIENVPYITDTIKQNREIFKLSRSFGYTDFYLVPLGAANGGGRIMLAVATKSDDITLFRDYVESCKKILCLLAEAIDYIGTRKFPEFFLCRNESQKIVITPKPLIVLNTLAQDDLTLVQTADKLCISIHTADKHICAAKKALGASTIHGAIYKAIKVGLIDGY